MFTVYVLRSIKTGRYYIGQTEDMNSRMKRHNSGLVISTKHSTPWKMVYSEKYETRSEACKRELEIKKYKGGIKFKKLLGLWKGA